MDLRRSRGRLAVLLFGVVLATGVVSTAAAASGDLPACSVADTLTKHRTLADWRRSILDSRYRLSSAYKPGDLRSTSAAGLNSGFKVRKGVIADLKAMAASARKAGARLPGPVTASTSSARPSTCGRTAGAPPGMPRTGAARRSGRGCASTPGASGSS